MGLVFRSKNTYLFIRSDLSLLDPPVVVALAHTQALPFPDEIICFLASSKSCKQLLHRQQKLKKKYILVQQMKNIVLLLHFPI